MQPYFHNIADFIHMAGHGSYVWASWALTSICIIGIILYSRSQRKQIYQNILTQQARQRHRQNHQSK